MEKVKEVNHILSVAMEAGKIMLENGAEIYRVEDTMDRIAKHYGSTDHHFFVLTNGIFVHNSKDLADAVCGSVANALEYPIVEEMQRENDIDFFLEDSKGYSYMSDKDELLNGFNFIN